MKRAALATCLLVPAAATPLAHAVDRVWTGGSGDWLDSSHWDPVGVPVGGDRVFVTAADSLHKVITFNDTRPIIPIYNSILIDESGPGSIRLEQIGRQLSAFQLTVGLGGPGTYRISGGTGGFVAATVNATGTLQMVGGRLNAVTFTQHGTVTLGNLAAIKADDYVQSNGRLVLNQGAGYTGVNFTQNGLGVRSIDNIMSLTGTYNYNAGTFDATPAVGSIITGGVSCATFNFNHPSGIFGGSIEVTQRLNFNLASITIAGDLINRSSFTLPAGNQIIGRQNAYQIGGSVVQAGTFSTPSGTVIGTPRGTLRIGGGGAWTQNGGRNANGWLIVGSGGGGDATYILNDGTVGHDFSSGLIAGYVSDGTFIQNGGTVLGGGLIVGGAPTANFAAERGVYIKHGGVINAGTLGTIIVGRNGSVGGAFTQHAGSTSTGSLILNENATNHAVFTLAGGTFTSGGAISHGWFNQTGGVSTFSGHFDGAGSITLTGNAMMTVPRIRQNAVHVGGDARIVQGENLFELPTHRVFSLTFEDGPGGTVRGRWDLHSAPLVIDYSGPSPLNDVKRYLASGYAGGNWNGTGLMSSFLSAASSRALGYAEASDVLGPAGGTFQGVHADATSVLVRFVYYGDANLDGRINLADFNRLATNFGTSNKIWSQGDFTYDGLVNLADFNRLASNFGLSAGPDGVVDPEDWANLAAAVPEPAGVCVALCMPTACAAARRRRQRA